MKIRPARNIAHNPVDRAAIETLEARRLLTTFFVDTLFDAAGDGDGSMDGSVSLREAIIASNTDSAFGDAAAGTGADTIIFSSDIGGGTVSIGGGEFAVTEDLTIRAADGVTIDAGGSSRIFNVTGADLRLEIGITLTNGMADEGGAIFVDSDSTLFMSRGAIASSTATGAMADEGGGAIYADGDIDIDRVDFSGNVASGASGSGGAILANGDVVIEGSSFDANIANRAGGAIELGAGTGNFLSNFTDYTNNVAGPSGSAAPGNGGAFHVTGAWDIRIWRGDVTGNTAAAEGGGLWNQAGSTMEVDQVNLFDNTASGDDADNGGGGVFNNGGDLFLTKSILNGNTADGASGSGGGLLSVDGNVVVGRSFFIQNVANRAGGAIEVIAGDYDIDATRFNGNVAGPSGSAAPGNGGALHVSAASTVDITSSRVTGNIAASEGGGLWNQAGATMNVSLTSVTDNTASGDDADNGGGGLFNNGGDLTVTNTRVLDNTADGASGSGGGLLSTDGNVTITRGRFNGNVANRAGGAVEIIDGNLTFSNTRLVENIAGPSGSAAPGNGGALHVTGVATTNVDNTLVRDNVAASEGGGLWNQAGSTLNVTDSDLQDNIAQGDAADNGGGGIFNNGGEVNVTNSNFVNNVANGASGSGGGLFSVDGPITLDGTRFQANVANRAGGAIELIDGNFDADDLLLRLNTAGPSGSAAPGNGGGLHITGVSTVDISNSTISANTAASEGGGLWNQVGSTMTVTNTELRGNNANGTDADNGGGGIFNNGGTLIVDSSTLIDNSAVSNGGGIFNNETLILEDSTVTQNDAAVGGGVFTAADATTTVVGSTSVTGNTPDDFAGPGAVTNGTRFTVTVSNVSQAGLIDTDRAAGAVPLSPGAFAVFTGSDPAFQVGQLADSGTELIAEDGFPSQTLSPAGTTGTELELLQAASNVSTAGTFQSDGGADNGPAIFPAIGGADAESATFSFIASEGDLLQLETMFVQSNDWFYGFGGGGLALFNGSTPISGDVTSSLALYDAGTEADTAPGTGPDQKPVQDPNATNVGPAESLPIQLAADRHPSFTIPATNQVIQVTITTS